MAPASIGHLLSLKERMADPRGAPGFGQIDLDIEDDQDGAVVRAPAETPASGSFGQLDFDVEPPDPPDEPAPPPSRSRVFGPDTSEKPEKAAKNRNISTRATRKNMSVHESVHDESTRIVSGDALSHITRPPPPPSAPPEDGNTRAW